VRSSMERPLDLSRHELEALLQSDLSLLATVEVGVATSSFQTEGSLDIDGHPQTNWARWQREGRLEHIGPACDLWGRFDLVTDRLRAMRARVFRMSFEWARLWPDSERTDLEAARGYATRLARLRRAGIEPIVTLQHFTHPAWLGEDFWLDRRSPELFATYARRAVSSVQSALVALGERPVVRWLTINELNMLALGTYLAGVFPHGARALLERSAAGVPRALLALDHLATAHILAYDAIHREHDARGWPRPDVSYNPNLVDLYTLGAQWLDVMRTGVSTARARQSFIEQRRSRFEGRFLEPDGLYSTRADVAREIDRSIAAPLALEAFERLSRALSERGRMPAIDSRAFDLYDPWTRHQARGAEAALDELARRELGPATASASVAKLRLAEPWEWYAEPVMLRRALDALHDPHDPVPLDVMENGMASERPPGGATREREDRVRRPQFIAGYARAFAFARCVLALPARTYAHWTLVDNYELGRWCPRFGLFALADPEGDRAGLWSERDALGDDAASELARFADACADGARARAWIEDALREASPER
jgi:beta-glucosidase